MGAFIREDRLFSILFPLFLLLYLLPLLIVRHLPMQDLPGHLAMVELWRHPTASDLIANEYQIRGGLPPYLTYYGLLRLLGSIVSLETANQLILIGYALLLPFSFLFLLITYGRDRRYALLSLPFIYNISFVYGFVANLLFLPVLFFSLGLLKRYLDAPTVSREVILALLVIILYFTHIFGAVVFAVAAPVVFFAHLSKTWLTKPWLILRRSLFVWPGLLAAYWSSARMNAHAGFGGDWRTVLGNMEAMLQWINNILKGQEDEIVLVVLALTVLAILLLPSASSEKTVFPRAHWSLGVGGIGVFILYFLTPAHMQRPYYHWATNVRFVVPALLLLLTIPRASLRGIKFLVLVPLLCTMSWEAFALCRSFLEFDRQARSIDSIVEILPENRRVLGLVYDSTDKSHQAYVFRQYPLLYQVRKGGYMPQGFFSEPHMPVQFRRPPTPTPFYQNPREFNYAVHGRHYDYFLTVFPAEENIGNSFPGAGANVQLIKKNGRFAVYQNTGPLKPKS